VSQHGNRHRSAPGVPKIWTVPPAARPLRPSFETRRKELSLHFLQVLESVLRTERYADLKVEEVIVAGGIARSTFYVYFADKGELLCAMADEVLDQIFSVGRSWWDFPDGGGRAELRQALLAPINAYLEHAAILGAVAESASQDERVRARQTRLIDELARDLAAHIHRAQDNGSACPELDPERTAKWMLWIFDRALYELVADADQAETEKQLDAVTMIIWRTVYAGYRPGS
jgi:AcrR family transcriptional regulator